MIIESSVRDDINIQSGGQANYVDATFSPDTLVSRQDIEFTAAFTDTGTADITLNPDSSYFELIGTGMDPVYLSGRYTIKGKDSQTGVLDSTTLSFNPVTMPSGLTPGLYDVFWFMSGNLADGQFVQSQDTIYQAFEVIPEAAPLITAIEIDSSRVRQGQQNISIRLQLQNSGVSTARIQDIQFGFNHIDSGQDVANEWLIATEPAFPDTLAGSATLTKQYYFDLTSAAAVGQVVPEPRIIFNDLRTADITEEATGILLVDTVEVIAPALIQIDSVYALAPNIPFVNQDQQFELRTVLHNLGSDTIQIASVSLTLNGVLFETRSIQQLAPDDTAHIVSFSSIASSGTNTFKAKIDSALDLTGKRISINQPQDNLEALTVMREARLEAFTQITEPEGALDFSLSAAQRFNVRAAVTNNGDAGYGAGRLKMNLPAGFSFAGDTLSLRTFNEDTEFVEWSIVAGTEKTPGTLDDLITRFYEIPLDENTANTAVLDPMADTIQVQVNPAGAIAAENPEIVDPAGATDGIISTAQEFTLRSAFSFNESMDFIGRQARIVLPSGYSVQDSSVVSLESLSDQDTVQWKVIAPVNVKTTPDSIYVAYRGNDKNNASAKQAASNKQGVQLINNASLQLSMAIVEPVGAIDDTVSQGQIFKLSALVKNRTNSADVSGMGSAVIRLGNALHLVNAQGDPLEGDSIRVINEGVPVSWQIKVDQASSAPAFVGQDLAEQYPLSTVISALTDNEIEVELLEVPLDENTNLPAYVQNTTINKQVQINGLAEITNIDIAVQDTLSTGQNYSVTATLSASETVGGAQAQLTLPASLGSSPAAVSFNEQNQVVWNLTVPDSYAGTGIEQLSIGVSALDINSGLTVSGNTQSSLTIQRKAILGLGQVTVSPTSVANTGLVSRGQEVTIKLKPVIPVYGGPLEIAGIEPGGVVLLDSSIIQQGFTLMDGTFKQTFSDTGEVLSWTVKAPQQDLTSNLNFRYETPSIDQNSGLPAAISNEEGTAAVALRVRQKTIVVEIDNDAISDTSFATAEGNVPLLAFSVSNADYDDPLKIRGLRLAFYNSVGDITDDNLLSPKALFAMLQSISVVNAAEAQSRLDKTSSVKDGAEFIRFTLSDTVENPVQIVFDQDAEMAARADYDFVVLAEFQDNVINRGFRAVLRGVHAYDFDPDSPLEIIDSSGVKIEESENLESKAFTVVSDNPEEGFFNYPNPFGRQYPYTSIQFLLENPSDVQIRIFTLMGEAVWSRSLPGLAAGLYENLVRWDGKNGRGYQVLNGVYLCTIEIRPTNGQPNKRFITKIAYIK